MSEGAAVADSGLTDEAIKIASGFGGFGGGLVFARWFIGWLTNRHDQREAELRAEDSVIDKKWQEYREAIELENATLRERVARLEIQHEECHAKNRELEKRLARLEGFASARGDIRADQQFKDSALRVELGGEQ